MMTAMARLPCKQQTSQQPKYIVTPQHHGGYGQQSRVCWDMDQPAVAPPPAYATRGQHRSSLQADQMSKRKSAVELLQESKAFYVKSETVLDRKQELKNSGHFQVSQLSAPGAPPRLLRKSCPSPQLQHQGPLPVQSQCCWATTCLQESERPLPPKSPRLVTVPVLQRRTVLPSTQASANSEQLQAKLRRLLNTDSKENVFFPEQTLPPPEYANPSPVIGDKFRDDRCRYSPGESLSPGCRDDERAWVAAGGEARFKFGRSNSHSHGRTRQSQASSGANSRGSSGDGGNSPGSTGYCHKSLPDLHTSTRRHSFLSPRASTRSSSRKTQASPCPDCETGSDYSDHSFNRDSVCYRSGSSSRHIRSSMGLGGGDASSVLSSGSRTQKSSGSSKFSHGATARDSGGSSGHCTHRSDPPPKVQDCWNHARRDSGASTQHSIERDRSRRSGGSHKTGTPPPPVERRYTADTDSGSNSQDDCSPTCNSRLSDGWKEGRNRPILRSKSDISDRYWRHDSASPRLAKTSPRPQRSLTQLESFFDRLGLEPDSYRRLTEPDSRSSSPVFFDSVSSVDSALGMYPGWPSQAQWAMCGSGSNAILDDCGASQKSGDPPSIIERNARIIKWLCQCRKVQFGYS